MLSLDINILWVTLLYIKSVGLETGDLDFKSSFACYSLDL